MFNSVCSFSWAPTVSNKRYYSHDPQHTVRFHLGYCLIHKQTLSLASLPLQLRGTSNSSLCKDPESTAQQATNPVTKSRDTTKKILLHLWSFATATCVLHALEEPAPCSSPVASAPSAERKHKVFKNKISWLRNQFALMTFVTHQPQRLTGTI